MKKEKTPIVRLSKETYEFITKIAKAEGKALGAVISDVVKEKLPFTIEDLIRGWLVRELAYVPFEELESETSKEQLPILRAFLLGLSNGVLLAKMSIYGKIAKGIESPEILEIVQQVIAGWTIETGLKVESNKPNAGW